MRSDDLITYPKINIQGDKKYAYRYISVKVLLKMYANLPDAASEK